MAAGTELIKAKGKLESDLMTLVDAFNADTGVEVTWLSINYPDSETFPRSVGIVNVELRLEKPQDMMPSAG